MRVREHESVFWNSTKRLEFLSARIECASAEWKLGARANAILKHNVAKRTISHSLGSQSTQLEFMEDHVMENFIFSKYFQIYWIHWAPCVSSPLFLYFDWYFACFSLHIYPFIECDLLKKWQKEFSEWERRIKTWWKMATSENQG